MNIKMFFCILLFKTVLSINVPKELIKSPLFHNLVSNSKGNENNIESFILKLGTILINIFNNTQSSKISPKCKSSLLNLTSIYNKDAKREMMLKFILDSSLTKDELHFFDNCMHISHIENGTLNQNYTYLIVSVENQLNENNDAYKRSRTDYETSFYINGFCLPQNQCNAKDYVYLFQAINDLTGYDALIRNESRVKAYLLDKDFRIERNIISIIIMFILAIQIILVISHSLIFNLLNICFKLKNKNKIKNSNNNDKKCCSIQRWIKKLNKCFSFKENFGELFNYSSNSTEVNNYSGLIEIRGLNAISILLTIIGLTFIVLFNSPLKLTGISQMKLLLENPLYTLIFIGLRFSPRIIFSCSGYTLVYKYLCAIEKNISFFKFILYQSHKLFIFFILKLFYQYTLNHIVVEIIQTDSLPIWVYFQRSIMGNEKIFGKEEENKYGEFPETEQEEESHSFFRTLFSIVIGETPSRLEQNIIDYFWIVINEIIFFFFCNLSNFNDIQIQNKNRYIYYSMLYLIISN
jgi:hypothetical protein